MADLKILPKNLIQLYRQLSDKLKGTDDDYHYNLGVNGLNEICLTDFGTNTTIKGPERIKSVLEFLIANVGSTFTDYTDSYFHSIAEICTGYENCRKARQDEKDALMKADDWDGVKAWNEREKQFPYPFSAGYMTAYRAWQGSRENDSRTSGEPVFEVSNLPWDKEAYDFVACLKEACVTEFAITDQSTALMQLLHILEDEGCKLKCLCKVTRSECRFGRDNTETYDGILMEIS